MADAKIVLSAVDQTKAAIESAKRNLSSIGEQIQRVDLRFGALGATIVAAFSGASLKGAIDMLDQLDDLSEKTGIAVQSLSALRYAGEVVGTPIEAIATGVKKLSVNMAEAAGGSREAQAVFKALGVTVKNADGSLRDQDAVLLDIADRFSEYRDGAAKAALAQQVFGKSGADMIPLLNQGRAGIEALRDEASKLGAVYGRDLAKAAAEFNDNLKRLQLGAEALKVEMADGLLPTLNKLIDGFLRLKSAGLVWPVIKDAAKGVVGLNRLTNDPGADINTLMRDRVRTQKSLDFARRRGYATGDLQSELFDTEQLLEVSRLRQQQRALSGGDYGDQISRRFMSRQKKDAPTADKTVDKGGKSEAQKQAELLAELAGLTGTFAEDWQRLSDVFAAGKINLEQLTQAQAALLAKQPAVRTEAEKQLKVEKEWIEEREKKNKAMEDYLEAIVKENATLAERNRASQAEIEETGLTAEQLTALRVARINSTIATEQQRLAQLELNGATESELFLLRQRIELLSEQRDQVPARARAEKAARDQEDAKRRTEQLSESIEQGILTGFRNGQSAADIFVNELKAQFAKTILRPIISPIAAAGDAFMSSILSGFGGIFGGGSVLSGASAVNSFDSGAMSSILGFADGGRPPLGKVSIVGERGPELFVPDSAGTIIPNGKLGGRSTVVYQTIQMTVGDVATMQQVRQAIQSSQAASAAQLRRSIDYGGGLG